MSTTYPLPPVLGRPERRGRGTMSFAAPLGVEVTSCEPQVPFSRYTANPATATTTAANSGIHRRLSRPPRETRCIRGSFDERQYAHLRYDTSSADIDQATAAQPAVSSRWDSHREVAGALPIESIPHQCF